MTGMVVGREDELSALDRFLGELKEGFSALLLEGIAGIGKSTLWLAGVERGRVLGLQVLSSRPAEAERGLAYAGLGDLLAPVLDDVLPGLSPPRRRALEVALLLEDGRDADANPRAIGGGLHDALEMLAEAGPVLIAIDDVQWFDRASTSALSFALRRVDDARVGVLLAQRRGEVAAPDGLQLALGGTVIERLRIGPLSVGALHRLLLGRTGRPIARQTLLRVHEWSGGNPLYALELVGSLDRELDPLEPLPLPENVEQLLGARIARLPSRTRDALGLVAALGAPSNPMLRRAGVSAAALGPALRARVVERDGETICFTHPLLSSVAYRELGEKRRSVHARIARAADDPLARARHLALAQDEPDVRVARSLDTAARRAGERGAAALAAELCEHALRLTPSGATDERRRRKLAASRAQLAAGEWTRARSMAAEVLEEARSGPPRAEALMLLADIEVDDLAVPLLEEALAECGERKDLRARIHIRLSAATRFRRGLAGAREEGRIALSIADELGDNTLRFAALSVRVWLGSVIGADDVPREITRMRELATCAGDEEMRREVNRQDGWILTNAGRLDEDRALLEGERARWSERDELHAADLSWTLAWVELWSGRWDVAAAHAQQARDVSLQYGLEKNQDYIPSSWVAVHRGQFDLALAEAARGLELCETQIGFDPPLLRAVPGARRALGRRSGWRGALARAGRSRGSEIGVGGAVAEALDGRLRGGAARARSDRRRGPPARPLGGRRASPRSPTCARQRHPLPRARRRCRGSDRLRVRAARRSGADARGRRRSVRAGPGAARRRRG